MFELLIGTNTERNRVLTPLGSTIRQALEKANIDYSRGSIHLDGATLKAGDLDKKFSELGITTKAILVSVVKGDAA